MIKRLNIKSGHPYSLINDPFEAKRFCEILFSNIEHLECENGHGKEMLF